MNDAIAAARSTPPRYCTQCGRRLEVQVFPDGFSARCRVCDAAEAEAEKLSELGPLVGGLGVLAVVGNRIARGSVHALARGVDGRAEARPLAGERSRGRRRRRRCRPELGRRRQRRFAGAGAGGGSQARHGRERLDLVRVLARRPGPRAPVQAAGPIRRRGGSGGGAGAPMWPADRERGGRGRFVAAVGRRPGRADSGRRRERSPGGPIRTRAAREQVRAVLPEWARAAAQAGAGGGAAPGSAGAGGGRPGAPRMRPRRASGLRRRAKAGGARG